MTKIPSSTTKIQTGEPERGKSPCEKMRKAWEKPMVEGSEIEEKTQKSEGGESSGSIQKPLFRLATDDTKPFLRDPVRTILRSDPIETEEAVLRLPPFPNSK
ncbi:uncharacterized protein LOC131240549 [Magnolia sinica]|uniref:uncharacterized protein LOC131240549 n=1 Tax=Magnolia sinica TaxID=86752 RepID=UPI00265956A6|nr:uncharacterized protein LOC131240549 [Magnolia sinica]